MVCEDINNVIVEAIVPLVQEIIDKTNKELTLKVLYGALKSVSVRDGRANRYNPVNP